MRMLSAAIIIGILTISAIGQTSPRRWAYHNSYSNTGTSIVVTVKMPANSAKAVRGVSAVISCPSPPCLLTGSLNGTEATATPIAFSRSRTQTPSPASAVFYGPSNASGGEQMPSVKITGDGVPVELADFEAYPGEQFTLTLTAGTSQALGIFVKTEEFPK